VVGVRKGAGGLGLALAVALAIGGPVLAFDGDLDPGFGGDGIVVTNTPGNAYDRARDVIVDSSDRVVAAGWTGATGSPGVADFLVARYDSTGELDGNFSSDGLASAPVGTEDDTAEAIAEQDDGKLVVVGQAEDAGGFSDLAVVRFNEDGTLDESFDGDSGNGNGVVTIASAPGGDTDIYANDVAIQDDGKIVVAGAADVDSTAGQNYDMVVARLGTDGRLDDTTDGDTMVSFDTDGIALTDFTGAGSFDGANAVAIQDNGRIVAAGDASPDSGDADAAFARYTTAGALDDTFDGEGDGNGKVLVDFAGGNDSAIDLTIEDDALLLAAGDAGGSIGLTRLESAGGGFDDALAGDGTAISTFGADTSAPVIEAVDQLSDGRIVVTGTATVGSNVDFAFARYLPDGTPDPDFGGDGTVTAGASSSIADRAHGAGLTQDDRIVAAGFIANDAPTDRDVEVMRLRDDETAPQTEFTRTPKKKLKTKKTRKRVKFEFSASEEGPSFECRLDHKPPTGCTSPHSFKAKRGKHVFRVTATDAVGNEDPTPAEFRFKVKKKKRA
jgi:uncharacterized delta-60 repeat protein